MSNSTAKRSRSEQTVKTSLRLRREIHDALHAQAAREQRSVTLVMHRWLEQGRAVEAA